MKEEPTERGRIQREIDKRLSFPVPGRVTTVYEHTDAGDLSNHEADVVVPPGSDHEPTRMPIVQPSSGELHLPTQGDLVLVGFFRGDGDRPFVYGHLYGDRDDDRAPLGQAGIIRQKRGSLYVEQHPDGDWARIARKPADDGTPSAKIEMDTNGTITIEAASDIVLSAPNGDVTVDEGGTEQKVAIQTHDHDVSGTTSDGASFSETTTTPNQAGTETEIE